MRQSTDFFNIWNDLLSLNLLIIVVINFFGFDEAHLLVIKIINGMIIV